jgi:hypothetical protein
VLPSGRDVFGSIDDRVGCSWPNATHDDEQEHQAKKDRDAYRPYRSY